MSYMRYLIIVVVSIFGSVKGADHALSKYWKQCLVQSADYASSQVIEEVVLALEKAHYFFRGHHAHVASRSGEESLWNSLLHILNHHKGKSFRQALTQWLASSFSFQEQGGVLSSSLQGVRTTLEHFIKMERSGEVGWYLKAGTIGTLVAAGGYFLLNQFSSSLSRHLVNRFSGYLAPGPFLGSQFGDEPLVDDPAVRTSAPAERVLNGESRALRVESMIERYKEIAPNKYEAESRITEDELDESEEGGMRNNQGQDLFFPGFFGHFIRRLGTVIEENGMQRGYGLALSVGEKEEIKILLESLNEYLAMVGSSHLGDLFPAHAELVPLMIRFLTLNYFDDESNPSLLRLTTEKVLEVASSVCAESEEAHNILKIITRLAEVVQGNLSPVLPSLRALPSYTTALLYHHLLVYRPPIETTQFLESTLNERQHSFCAGVLGGRKVRKRVVGERDDLPFLGESYYNLKSLTFVNGFYHFLHRLQWRYAYERDDIIKRYAQILQQEESSGQRKQRSSTLQCLLAARKHNTKELERFSNKELRYSSVPTLNFIGYPGEDKLVLPEELPLYIGVYKLPVYKYKKDAFQGFGMRSVYERIHSFSLAMRYVLHHAGYNLSTRTPQLAYDLFLKWQNKCVDSLLSDTYESSLVQRLSDDVRQHIASYLPLSSFIAPNGLTESVMALKESELKGYETLPCLMIHQPNYVAQIDNIKRLHETAAYEVSSYTKGAAVSPTSRKALWEWEQREHSKNDLQAVRKQLHIARELERVSQNDASFSVISDHLSHMIDRISQQCKKTALAVALTKSSEPHKAWSYFEKKLSDFYESCTTSTEWKYWLGNNAYYDTSVWRKYRSIMPRQHLDDYERDRLTHLLRSRAGLTVGPVGAHYTTYTGEEVVPDQGQEGTPCFIPIDVTQSFCPVPKEEYEQTFYWKTIGKDLENIRLHTVAFLEKEYRFSLLAKEVYGVSFQSYFKRLQGVLTPLYYDVKHGFKHHSEKQKALLRSYKEKGVLSPEVKQFIEWIEAYEHTWEYKEFDWDRKADSAYIENENYYRTPFHVEEMAYARNAFIVHHFITTLHEVLVKREAIGHDHPLHHAFLEYQEWCLQLFDHTSHEKMRWWKFFEKPYRWRYANFYPDEINMPVIRKLALHADAIAERYELEKAFYEKSSALYEQLVSEYEVYEAERGDLRSFPFDQFTQEHYSSHISKEQMDALGNWHYWDGLTTDQALEQYLSFFEPLYPNEDLQHIINDRQQIEYMCSLDEKETPFLGKWSLITQILGIQAPSDQYVRTEFIKSCQRKLGLATGYDACRAMIKLEGGGIAACAKIFDPKGEHASNHAFSRDMRDLYEFVSTTNDSDAEPADTHLASVVKKFVNLCEYLWCMHELQPCERPALEIIEDESEGEVARQTILNSLHDYDSLYKPLESITQFHSNPSAAGGGGPQ